MSLSRLSFLLREAVKSTRSGIQPAVRKYSSGGGGGKKEETFLQKHGLNVIGLPVVAFVLFFILPTFTPGEIHSIDYYDAQYVEQEKKKEAAKAAARAAAAAPGSQ